MQTVSEISSEFSKRKTIKKYYIMLMILYPLFLLPALEAAGAISSFLNFYIALILIPITYSYLISFIWFLIRGYHYLKQNELKKMKIFWYIWLAWVLSAVILAIFYLIIFGALAFVDG